MGLEFTRGLKDTTPESASDAGLTCDLAPGLGHHGRAAFLAADNRFDAVRIVKPVEGGQKALPWHREGRGCALGFKLIDQDFAAVTHISSLFLACRVIVDGRCREVARAMEPETRNLGCLPRGG